MARISSVFASDWTTADREFRRAIELGPNDADAHSQFGSYLIGSGRFDEGEAMLRKAQQLDPFSAPNQTNYADLFLVTHRYDDAIAGYTKALSINPAAQNPHGRLAIAYHLKGLDDQAMDEEKTQLRLIDGDADVADAAATGFAEGGFTLAMRRAAEALQQRAQLAYVAPSRIANLFALAGDGDRVLLWLQRSLEAQELTPATLRMPVFDFMRGNAAFDQLVERRLKPPA